MSETESDPGLDEIQDDTSEASLSGCPIVRRARRRFRRFTEWESVARSRFIEDIRFENGDSDNGYQWDSTMSGRRTLERRPCLTMNIVKQHNLQVTNQGRKVKSAAVVKAVGGGASADSAKMYDALVRHIQYSSNAQGAYTLARGFQVGGGIGYWRIVTEWASPDSFDQDIFIVPVTDPLMIGLDPTAKQPDKSDSKWGFAFDLVPREEFREAYPKWADRANLSPLGTNLDWTWTQLDQVMVCEYFEVEEVEDELASFVDETSGERMMLRKSLAPKEVWASILALPLTRTRTVSDRRVLWFLIVNQEVVDETVWMGKYIPIIPCIGRETIIDGVLDRAGLTRSQKDGQRMYNYNNSAQVEFGALQSKTPWVGAAAAIEEFQEYWESANTVNHAILPYKHKDEDGEPLEAPRRQEPPASAPAFTEGAKTAFEQLMMVTGQWQNQMGMGGNERTGEAIQQRQDQGDTATFDFQDNFNTGLVLTAKQIVDLIPKIYDTKRVLQIQADDGSDMDLQIDPQAQVAYQQKLSRDGKIAARILNPLVGKYEVVAVPGDSGTKREQTVQAMTLLLTQAPGLTGIIGDLLLSAMDFKEAQEASLRLKRMVPPQALGLGPSQNEQELQQQVQQLTVALAEALQQAGKDRLKLVGKSQMRDIDVYKAESDRIKALLKPAEVGDPDALKTLITQLINEAAGVSLQPILDANQDDLDIGGGSNGTPSGSEAGPGDAPLPGARRAPDGEWYLADPTRRGKYLKVAPLAQKRNVPGVISNA